MNRRTSDSLGKAVWGVADTDPRGLENSWVEHAARALSQTASATTVSYRAGTFKLRSISCAAYVSASENPEYPGLTLAADVRLTNRSDVAEALGLKHFSLQRLDDEELLLAAYQKWGPDCPRFLAGEFAFAIWDNRSRRLFCCRDHLGIRPLYYWRHDSRFVFASDIRTILNVPGIERRLNRRKLATAARYRWELFLPEQTFHEGIYSLPAGTSLTVDDAGLRLDTYWKPEIRDHLVPRDHSEAMERLREILFQVVAAHAGEANPVGAFLSGGLDSSSVVSVLSRELEKSGRDVVALSVVLPKSAENQLADERDFIGELRSKANVRIEYVTAEGRGPFDAIEEPEQFSEVPLRISRFYLYDAFAEIARDHGIAHVLGGIGGEWGVSSWAMRYYVELAVELRWLTLFNEMKLMKRRKQSRLRFLASQFRSTLPGPAPSFEQSGVFFAPGFELSTDGSQPWRCYWPYHRREQASRIREFQVMHALPKEQKIIPGFRETFPLLDRRILEFCLAAPGAWNVRDGYQRRLVRDCLDGILPPKIQWRSDKMPFSPDYYLRYNHQLPKAREFVAAIGPKDPVRSVIDVEKLARALQPVDPRFSNAIARDAVPETIYTICFLRQFSEFRY